MSAAEQHAPVTPINAAPLSNAELIARRATLKADAEYIQDEIDRIDAALILRFPVGTHDVDGTKVQIREYTRTDPTAIAADYPAGEYPQLYGTTLDMDVVKQQFAPAALEQYVIRGKKSVVIK